MKAWIITGGELFPEGIASRPKEGDLVIAADAGLRHARTLGIDVDAVVGDYDSLGHAPDVPPEVEVLTVPAEKDATDTQLAVEIALRRGADDVVLLGGLGGRLDHTLSNLALLEDLAEKHVSAVIENGQNRVRYLRAGSTLLAHTDYRYLSLLAADPTVRGVDIEGVKYPLKNATLHRNFQYAVSNEITGNCCFISVRRGALLIVESKDL